MVLSSFAYNQRSGSISEHSAESWRRASPFSRTFRLSCKLCHSLPLSSSTGPPEGKLWRVKTMWFWHNPVSQKLLRKTNGLTVPTDRIFRHKTPVYSNHYAVLTGEIV